MLEREGRYIERHLPQAKAGDVSAMHNLGAAKQVGVKSCFLYSIEREKRMGSGIFIKRLRSKMPATDSRQGFNPILSLLNLPQRPEPLVLLDSLGGW